MDKQFKQDSSSSSWVRGTAIGKGSFGTVSLAFRNNAADSAAAAAGSDCVFAVKSVNKNSCLPSQIEALENEIRILRSVSSPYVVEYFGDDETEEGTSEFRNLHMEYLPGGTVADVARARRLDDDFGVEEERMIRNYAFCVASGLKYLHSQGIVHCDVKGDNVLVGPTPGNAKLADFGSSAASTAGKYRILPRGSPLWMAPEVIRGEYQGPESDVWSLGCTVIEMVTGKPAWEDKGAAETIRRIGYSDESPRIPTQLSETGRDFVEKCLRRGISQRWSCDQLLQHPFLSKCTQAPEFATYASPRCVLDWFNLDSDMEEDEEITSICQSDCSLEAKDRIGKLNSGGGAIWESDGWTLVRGLVGVTEVKESAAALSVSDNDDETKEEVGTSSGYWGIEGSELEDEDSFGIGELRKSTSVEYLADSFYRCGSICPAVETEHPHCHHDNGRGGGVTGPNDRPGRVIPEPVVVIDEESHPRFCGNQYLQFFLCWSSLLLFHRFDHTISCCNNLMYFGICLLYENIWLHFNFVLVLLLFEFGIFTGFV
ncbi:OLC1v1006265C1 [Oldenlandia corymbosa var. corymbosa]|uniref:OLC1v1006265C1 n=1 Tax=Oldenlandia corymbosa var. corymbosa TaxID=529605 RepID=A0AAV1DIP9_OLDCO|nr:OLC1v1006265C1 [Oldenlandia corymbosa var. corymbosa]